MLLPFHTHTVFYALITTTLSQVKCIPTTFFNALTNSFSLDFSLIQPPTYKNNISKPSTKMPQPLSHPTRKHQPTSRASRVKARNHTRRQTQRPHRTLYRPRQRTYRTRHIRHTPIGKTFGIIGMYPQHAINKCNYHRVRCSIIALL